MVAMRYEVFYYFQLKALLLQGDPTVQSAKHDLKPFYIYSHG